MPSRQELESKGYDWVQQEFACNRLSPHPATHNFERHV